MTETNVLLTPPLFREALVQAGPWTMTDAWQRWLSAFWQQQVTLWEQSQQAHVLGTGETHKLAVWQDASTLTHDTLLHYDRTQHWLGVGTATPTAPLTFPSVEGHKISLYGTTYGIGIAPGRIRLYGDASGGLSLGIMAGTTFTNHLEVTESGVQVRSALSQAHAPVSSYSFYGAFNGYFGGTFQTSGRVGIPFAPPVNVWVRTGSMSVDSLYLGGGDIAPRWPLDCPWAGHIGLLGAGYEPVAGYAIRASTCWMDSMGVGYERNASYSIRAGSSWFDRLGIGYAPNPTYSLTAGVASLDGLTVVGSQAILGTTGGVAYTNVGNTVGTGNLSNTIAFGWTGSQVTVRVDNYQAGALSLVAVSDRRAKEAIAADVPGLAAVCALEPISFLYRRDADAYGLPHGRHYGLVAQDAQPHVPLAVRDEAYAPYLHIDYDQLVPVLINAVKELTARVAALEGGTAWRLLS